MPRNRSAPIEKLKRLGLYLEGSHPPTPSSFIRLASRFFSETPLRTSNPPSTSCENVLLPDASPRLSVPHESVHVKGHGTEQ
jgi:hypothetical protein